MSEPLSTRFDPAAVEPRWQRAWEAAQAFRAPNGRPQGEGHFMLVLPPPNVTGTLTFGHSLGGTCQDVLARWSRMKGQPTLWLPGVDHAGLATQMAVRKHMEKNGVNASKFTAKELEAKIEEWRADKEAYIRRQLTAHGFSLDWSRYVYTMSEGYSRSVKEAFLRLYREGVVYRAERMINWDPKALTALSDLEVVPKESNGTLWHIRYPGEDGGEGIVVATTRPETLFGDVAVAVNPGDERHRAMIGRTVKLPLTGRRIPVISDPAVDPTFGNGALKITPSHDPVDHEVALRHPELPARRDVLDERGHLTGEYVPPAFVGKERFEARRLALAALKEEGLLVKEEPHVHRVGYSERSDVPIEPRLSTQWFVDVSRMGERALESVRSGKVHIYPSLWEKTYFHFMEDLKDWCISRQIVWGHEIPVWFCDACGSYDAYAEPPQRCPKCQGTQLHQERDVLDTWFSSWLWPFATLGWPEATRDLEEYYPVSVLVTGSDIVFFWVARMIMGGLTFTGRVPFGAVYLHGILTDREGRKLSKHLGNSPDPLELIEKWGADAFRFALLFPMPVDKGGYWDHQKMMEGSRNFLTKLWNMVRFLASTLPPGTATPSTSPPVSSDVFDRWILSRFATVTNEVDEALAAYEFTRAATTLHQFLWHEVADWYIEVQKETLKGTRGEPARASSSAVALYVIEGSLRLLHPMVPHVTEELWHAIPHPGEFLTLAPWPTAAPHADADAEARLAVVQELTRALRALKKDGGWPESERPKAGVRPTTPLAEAVLASPTEREAILRLAKVEGLELPPGGPLPEGVIAAVTPSGEVRLPRQGSTDTSRGALEREAEMLQGLLGKARARLEDPVFRSKAPGKVVRETEEKVKEMTERLARIGARLSEVA